MSSPPHNNFGCIVDDDEDVPSPKRFTQKSSKPPANHNLRPKSDEVLDAIRHDFLQDLYVSLRVNVSEWEAEFIESNLNRRNFSPAQRRILDRMRSKYESKM